MLTLSIWTNDYYRKGERISHQGMLYRIEAVKDWGKRARHKYELIVSGLGSNKGDTPAPIEYIIAKRFGKPGEDFMDTVERLVSP